jgi:hypothetical protein
MKSNVFIFHGTAGHPGENWFPWLKAKVEEKNYAVFVPQFPTPEGQSLEAWFKVLKNYEQYINEDTILVGHSLGGMFLLRLLEKLPHKVKAAFFVGTPIGIEPIKHYTSDYNFSGFNFYFDVIKSKADNFVVFHSDNDPSVGLANGEQLAKELGVDLSLVPNAGHFNTKAGYTKFEELWKKLELLLS